MKVSIQVVPPIVRPRVEKGIDWGAERRVLAIHADHELWWQSGHCAWVNRTTTNGYYPAQLSVALLRDGLFQSSTVTVFSGGRLTIDRMKREAARILDLLMLPRNGDDLNHLIDRIDRRYTTVFSVSR